ncbi:hypothetical protein ABKA04_003861 [Annulohypoxylon sp. FPYF3050]
MDQGDQDQFWDDIIDGQGSDVTVKEEEDLEDVSGYGQLSNQLGTHQADQAGHQQVPQFGNQFTNQLDNIQQDYQRGNQFDNQQNGYLGNQQAVQQNHQQASQYGNQQGTQFGNQFGSQQNNQPVNQHGFQQRRQLGGQTANQSGNELGDQFDTQQNNESDIQQGAHQSHPQNQPENQPVNQQEDRHYPPMQWDAEKDRALLFSMVINTCGNGQAPSCGSPKVPWPSVAASMQVMGYEISKDAANQRYLKHIIKEFPKKYEGLRTHHPFNSNLEVKQGGKQASAKKNNKHGHHSDGDDDGTYSNRTSYSGRKPRQKRQSLKGGPKSARKNYTEPDDEVETRSLGSNAGRSGTPLGPIPLRPVSALANLRSSTNTPTSLLHNLQNAQPNQQGQNMNTRNTGTPSTLRLNPQTGTYGATAPMNQNLSNTGYPNAAQQNDDGFEVMDNAGMPSTPQGNNNQYWMYNDGNGFPAGLPGQYTTWYDPHVARYRHATWNMSHYQLPDNYHLTHGLLPPQGTPVQNQTMRMPRNDTGGQASQGNHPGQNINMRRGASGPRNGGRIRRPQVGTHGNVSVPQGVQGGPPNAQNMNAQTGAPAQNVNAQGQSTGAGTQGSQMGSQQNQNVGMQGNASGLQGHQSIFGGPSPGQSVGTHSNTPTPQTVQNFPAPGQNVGMQSNAPGNQGFQNGPQGGQNIGMQSTPVQQQVGSRAGQNVGGMQATAPAQQQNIPQAGTQFNTPIQQAATPVQQQTGSQAGQNVGGMQATMPSQQNQQSGMQGGQNTGMQAATPVQQQTGVQGGQSVGGMQATAPTQQQNIPQAGLNVGMQSNTAAHPRMQAAMLAQQQRQQQQGGHQVGQNIGMQGTMPIQPQGQQTGVMNEGLTTNFGATPDVQDTEASEVMDVDPSQPQSLPVNFDQFSARHGLTLPQGTANPMMPHQVRQQPAPAANMGMLSTPTPAQQGQEDSQGQKRRAADDSDIDAKRRKTHGTDGSEPDMF